MCQNPLLNVCHLLVKSWHLWNFFLKRINLCQQRGATVSFSNAEQSSSVKRETKQLTSFAEEKSEEVRSVGTPFQQAGFQTAPLQEKNSLFNSNQQENSFSSSMANNQQNSFSSSSSQQQQMSSSTSVQKSQQMTTSSQSSSKSFSAMQSSNMVQKVRSNFWTQNRVKRSQLISMVFSTTVLSEKASHIPTLLTHYHCTPVKMYKTWSC